MSLRLWRLVLWAHDAVVRSRSVERMMASIVRKEERRFMMWNIEWV